MPFGDTSRFTLEICCSSIESLIVAQEHGADRIELCENLEQGGTTPSYGMIKVALTKAKVPVHVLIRPRPGHFQYSAEEERIMELDIQMCRDLGCAGVVIGAETTQGMIPSIVRTWVSELAAGMRVTYNRHFDNVMNLPAALECVIETGSHRLLTSGGAVSAEEGISEIANLVQRAKGRIEIMAGAGITADNVEKIVRQTGVREIHASCKRLKGHANELTGRRLFDSDIFVVDADALDRLVSKLQSIEFTEE